MKLIYRFFTWIIELGIIAVLALWNVPSVFGLNQIIGVSQAVAMRNLGTVALGVASLIWLVFTVFRARRKAIAGTLAVALIASTAWSGLIILSRGFDASVTSSEYRQVRILSWNTNDDSVPAKQVVSLAAKRKANVIALPEGRTSAALAIQRGLRARGLEFQLVPNSSSPSSLLIANSLGTYRYTRDSSQYIIGGIVASPDNPTLPTIVVMHAQQSGFVPTQAEQWRSHLRWYQHLCDSDNIILAGDMNATLDNLPSTSLGHCKSVALTTRSAAKGTWPTSLPADLGAAIDQVWTSKQWHARSFNVETQFDGAGSDHRPIFAVISK